MTVARLEIPRRGVRRRRDGPSRDSLRSNARGITFAHARGDERVDSRGEGVGGARATPRSWGANSEVEKRACHHDLVVVLVRTLARGRSLANLTIDLHLPDVVVLILATVQEVHDLDIPGHVARAVGGSQRGKSGTPLSRLVFRLFKVTALQSVSRSLSSSAAGFRRLAYRARSRQTSFPAVPWEKCAVSTARFYSRIQGSIDGALDFARSAEISDAVGRRDSSEVVRELLLVYGETVFEKCDVVARSPLLASARAKDAPDRSVRIRYSADELHDSRVATTSHDTQTKHAHARAPPPNKPPASRFT